MERGYDRLQVLEPADRAWTPGERLGAVVRPLLSWYSEMCIRDSLILQLDKLQPVGNPLGVLHQQQPDGGQKQGEQRDGHAGEPQVGACQRREIVVVRLLDDVEDGGGQDLSLIHILTIGGITYFVAGKANIYTI